MEDVDVKSIHIGKTLSRMINLEYICLERCGIDDRCLQFIGEKCTKLKYLNISFNSLISDAGLRALTDPSFSPFGKCNMLTMVIAHNFDSPIQVTAAGFADMLLHCSHLVKLQVPFDSHIEILKHVMIDSETTSQENQLYASSTTEPKLRSEVVNLNAVLPELPYCCDTTETKQHRIEPCIKMQTTSKTQHRTFMLEVLKLVRLTDACNFLHAVGKCCPHLKHLQISMIKFNPGDLAGLMNSKLQSLCIVGCEPELHFLEFEIIFLLNSIGRTLTKLSLFSYCQINLRLISQMCPNIDIIEISECDTSYSPELSLQCVTTPLFSFYFYALTWLELERVVLLFEDLVNLMMCPNLKFISINTCTYSQGEELRVRLPPVIEEVFSRSQNAFHELVVLKLCRIGIDITMLNTLLEASVVLRQLYITFCYNSSNWENIAFDEKLYIDELVRLNNWDLYTEWSIEM